MSEWTKREIETNPYFPQFQDLRANLLERVHGHEFGGSRLTIQGDFDK